MSNTKNDTAYRRIFKTTALFGGVQVVGIICSVIKNKLIAMWLGAEGVGIIGLYNLTTELIASTTGLGIRQSSVRNIAQAHQEGNPHTLSNIAIMVRRWSLLVGLFGAVITLSLSPKLSEWTFGDKTHMWGFVWLSCALLLNAITYGEQAILQGSERLRLLAKASVGGAVIGLLCAIPLYYIWRIDGIIPSIIAAALGTWFFTRIASKQIITYTTPTPTVRESYTAGKAMVQLGIYMTVGGFVSTLCSYLFVAYLNHQGGTTDVGYYQAGFTLVDRYVGLIFTAMATDYYPRLAATQNNRDELNKQVNNQSEMSILLLLPVIALFLALQSPLIKILYTSDFLIIKGYISWAIVGTIFKALSWCLGFVLLAKGAGKLYLITEVISYALFLLFNIAGYHLWGLDGVGIAFVVGYFCYLLMMLVVINRRYHIIPSNRILRLTAVALILLIPIFIATYTHLFTYSTFIIIGCTTAAVLFATWQLIHRLNASNN